MTKSIFMMFTLILALSLAMLAPGANAQTGEPAMHHAFMAGPGHTRGHGHMAYYHHDRKMSPETIKMKTELYQKRLELKAVLNADKIDEQKAKAIQTEINDLRGRLAMTRLDAVIEYKKSNPAAEKGMTGMMPGSRMAPAAAASAPAPAKEGTK